MKSNLIFLACCFVCITCKKEKSGYEPDCGGTAKSFASDVKPLIASNCATYGCHAGGSSNGPGALVTYDQVNAAKSGIRDAVVNGRMPKNKTLSDDEKNRIVCWIDAGAQDN